MGYLQKPWLKSYKLGPYRLETSLAPYPQAPVFHALDQAADSYPGQTALLFQGRSLRYAQLKDQVDRLASGLARLGVQHGNRVCLFLPNCMEFILSDWAVLKTGAAVVPTSVLRTAEGLSHEVGSSNSKVIICQERHLELVLSLRGRCDLEHIIVTSNMGYDLEAVSTPLPASVHELRRILNENDPVPPSIKIDPLNDLCELAFTGGATGVPKGVMVTHYNRMCCIRQGLPWFLKAMLKGFTGKASTLIAIPLFHAYGHYCHQASAYLGMRVILLPDPRDIDQMADMIRTHRPFLIPAVPTQLMRLTGLELARMNVIAMSGSAPLPSEVAATIKEKLGMPVSEGYGLTETSPLTHFNISAFSRITGFMSKDKLGIGVPSPDTECTLLDPDTGQEVPFGSPGEIVVRGPQVMLGYWPERGSGLTPDGWLHTGDIGVMDDDGYFQLVDRVKDMVNVSGLKVYTTQVDEILYKHPAVQMAAAFGLPDPDIPGSERVMAVVQLKPGSETISAEEIRQFCQAHLPVYAIPKWIEFRSEMTYTVTDKLFKKALREQVLERVKAGSSLGDPAPSKC
jgi:long-chain acyl-CoA synthetase